MAVIRNYGAQGGVIASLENRLPVGMGGFPPCEPRGFSAPRFYTLKSVDEATGVVTETPVLQCFTAADLAKLPEGRPMWIDILRASNKDEWNGYGQNYAKKNIEERAERITYDPTDEEIAQGYIVLPNDAVWMMARWLTLDAEGNDLYGDWGLNEVGTVSASPMYGVGRPLVTMAHDGAVAHVVSPCGTVWLDGVDTNQDEIWLAADKKKHSVTSKVGWAAKPVTVKEDGTVVINTVQFFSESAAAEVDFTSYSGTYEDAKAFADADEATMATAMATALGDGYHIFDVNPYTDMTNSNLTIKSIMLDAGGKSTTLELAWNEDLNGGLYRQRIAVGDGESAIYEGAVGCVCGDGLQDLGLLNSVVRQVVGGDIINTLDIMSSIILAATFENMGYINVINSIIGSLSLVNVDNSLYVTVSTIWSVTCGNFGNDVYFTELGAKVRSIKIGNIANVATIYNATVEEVIVGKADNGYDFSGSNFGKLTVTSTTVMTQTTPPDSVDEILVPAPLVSMYKTNSLFSADFADKIKAM